jgi:hypothetical protein
MGSRGDAHDRREVFKDLTAAITSDIRDNNSTLDAKRAAAMENAGPIEAIEKQRAEALVALLDAGKNYLDKALSEINATSLVSSDVVVHDVRGVLGTQYYKPTHFVVNGRRLEALVWLPLPMSKDPASDVWSIGFASELVNTEERIVFHDHKQQEQVPISRGDNVIAFVFHRAAAILFEKIVLDVDPIEASKDADWAFDAVREMLSVMHANRGR